MPLNINGTIYPMPNEGTEPGPNGTELVAIEDHWGLDALTLITALDPDAKVPAGYTKTKALYSLVWIAKKRAGEIVSISDVLNDIALEQIVIEDDPKADAAS